MGSLKSESETRVEASRDYFLPDFCGVRMVFVVVIMSELLAFALSLGPSTFSSNKWTDLSLISLLVQWVALTAAAMLCLLSPYLKKLSSSALAILSFIALMVQTLIVAEIARWMALYLNLALRVDPDWWFWFRWHCLGISAIVNAIALRYFYVQHQWRCQMEAEAQARIDALQARIRPHFLFNSMNTIASLTQTDPDLAETVVEDLAELFRATLDDPRNLVPLRDEVELTRRYLHIESLRLGERLDVQWQLGELPDDLLLPALSLQPLLENAIYHGVEPIQDGGRIEIVGRIRNQLAEIRISNPTLPGNERSHRKGNHMAQQNLRARLNAHFPGTSELLTEMVENTYQISIRVPLRMTDQ